MNKIIFGTIMLFTVLANAWTDYLPNHSDDNSQYINSAAFQPFYNNVFVKKYAVSKECYIRGNAVKYNGTTFNIRSYQIAHWYDEINLKMVTAILFTDIPGIGNAMLKRSASLRTVGGELLRDQFAACVREKPLYSADPSLTNLNSTQENQNLYLDFLFRMGQI